jgi:hypothetical protein
MHFPCSKQDSTAWPEPTFAEARVFHVALPYPMSKFKYPKMDLHQQEFTGCPDIFKAHGIFAN